MLRIAIPLCVLALSAGTENASRPGAQGGGARGASTPRTRTVETGPLAIDRIYRSMTGPYDLAELDTSDLDWVTAVHIDVIDAAQREPMGGEFFCHSQLQLPSGIRLAVNATGTESIEMPPGFAIPVGRILRGMPAENRTVNLLGMVLNNHHPVIDRRARIRATVEYFREGDLAPPPRKLYPFHIAMRVEDLQHYTPPPGEPEPHEDVTTHCVLVDGQQTHWFVPPGPQRTVRRFTGLVPIEATIHHITTHVHNHGEYVRLTDVTEGRVLWQADVEYESERRQIAHIPAYSSAEGLPVYPDREYEIEAYYDNKSDGDVDAMAVLYLYFNPKDDRDLFLPGSARAP